MTKARILLVDDHQMFRNGIKSVLNSRDDLIVIGEASNGKEGVEKAFILNPDVIVMDINMPIMNGIEATKIIKEANKEVRILMLTMIDNERYIIDALSHGADCFLSKDIEINELLNAIRTLASDEEYINVETSKKISNYLSYRDLKPNSIKKHLISISLPLLGCFLYTPFGLL